MKCRNCNQSNCIKKGYRNGRQRYHCKSCTCNFQIEYTYKAYRLNTNDLIKSLLREGCGVRSISRITGISAKTVLSRTLKISKA